jgi:hypothetical protein
MGGSVGCAAALQVGTTGIRMNKLRFMKASLWGEPLLLEPLAPLEGVRRKLFLPGLAPQPSGC